MLLRNHLKKVIELYNEKRPENEHLDWFEVREGINDIFDEKEVQKLINEILLKI